MSVEWLSLSKFVPTAATGLKALYDRVIGKSPRLNVDTSGSGVELHVFNTRDETIIIERIEADPRLLGFAEGGELRDVVRAAIDQVRGPTGERPIAVLSPQQKAVINLLKVQIEGANSDQLIKVKAYWRTARRRPFSRSMVSMKISVRDIRDLLVEVERKQPRIFSV